MATRIRPTNPHFFKPLLPDFRDGILIPLSFLKYLKGQKCEGNALLRTSRGKWRVKINGRRFVEEGWKKFAKENGLQVGDFLVFRHEGDMMFHVMVFDTSACVREYTSDLVEQIPKEEQQSSESDCDTDLTLADVIIDAMIAEAVKF